MDNNSQQPVNENQNSDPNNNFINQQPRVSTQQSPNIEPKKSNNKPVLVVLLVLLAAIAFGVGGYALGNSGAETETATENSTATNEESEENKLNLPEGATVLAQCAKGRGTQYALPKDIPLGPIYNVHEGEIIGIEYMIGKDELLVESKNFLNLPLNGAKYDHINVGLLSEGHAGFPSPHYHVDVMMAPTSVTEQITCA